MNKDLGDSSKDYVKTFGLFTITSEKRTVKGWEKLLDIILAGYFEFLWSTLDNFSVESVHQQGGVLIFCLGTEIFELKVQRAIDMRVEMGLDPTRPYF